MGIIANGWNAVRMMTAAALLTSLPQLAAAQTIQDSIVQQLIAQGFTRIEISQTLLGRTRVLAWRHDLQRELVFNGATGEILRDYWVRERSRGDASTAPRLVEPGNGAAGSSGSRPVTSGVRSPSNASDGDSGKETDKDDRIEDDRDDDDRDDDDRDIDLGDDRDDDDDDRDDDDDDRDDDDDDDDDRSGRRGGDR